MRFQALSELHTADAEDVELAFNGEDLELRYVDWAGRRVRAQFEKAVAFRWDPTAIEGAPRGDEAYEVLDSAWLQTVSSASQCPPVTFRHFKLCFNAASVLDVVAADVVVLATDP